jgi:hypothetical protein
MSLFYRDNSAIALRKFVAMTFEARQSEKPGESVQCSVFSIQYSIFSDGWAVGRGGRGVLTTKMGRNERR